MQGLPHSPRPGGLSAGLSAQRRQAEHAGSLKPNSGSPGSGSQYSSLPCQTSEWRGRLQISAPLRWLLRKTEFPNVCRHYFISEEKGLMGQGPHFKFKPVVQLTTLWSDRTHPNFQWHCGLFILVTIAQLPSPVTREEEAAV